MFQQYMRSNASFVFSGIEPKYTPIFVAINNLIKETLRGDKELPLHDIRRDSDDEIIPLARETLSDNQELLSTDDIKKDPQVRAVLAAYALHPISKSELPEELQTTLNGEFTSAAFAEGLLSLDDVANLPTKVQEQLAQFVSGDFDETIKQMQRAKYISVSAKIVEAYQEAYIVPGTDERPALIAA